MSLSEAMLDLAKEMEDFSETQLSPESSSDGNKVYHEIVGWVKCLRMLAKTAQTTQPENKPYDVRNDLAHKLANPSDIVLAQRAVERMHARQHTIASLEEMAAPRFAVCVDGPEQGTSIEVHPGVGEGSCVNVGGFAYEVQADGNLRQWKDKDATRDS